MKILIYKIKNRLYKISNEGKKIKRPKYEELKEYKNFTKKKNNKFALSFGAGRSGQNWFTKIFNNHSNWIGTCERFVEYETLYRYITYYNLPINKEGIYACGTTVEPVATWRKNQARFKELDQLAKAIKKIT